MTAYLFFTQKSITDMYNNRRIYDGSQYNSVNVTAFATNTHVNRLQEKILDKVPGLSVTWKRGQYLWHLTMESDGYFMLHVHNLGMSVIEFYQKQQGQLG